MLKTKLKNYLQFSHPVQRLQDHFHIPGTHLSISPLDLEASLLAEHGDHFLKMIESVNQKLEHNETRILYADSNIKKLSLAEHIDNWRNFFKFNALTGQVEDFKENLVINKVSQEDIYARLGFGVLNGELPKRIFRLHFCFGPQFIRHLV